MSLRNDQLGDQLKGRQGGHAPVMLSEALEYLDVRPGRRYLDATVGLGGHAAAILSESGPDGRLLGMDADPEALAVASERLAAVIGDRSERFALEQGYFDGAAEAVRAHGLGPLDGILCDLGVSSLQLDSEERGFSFQAEGPLDMRFGPEAETTAGEIVNTWSEAELADVIYEYGEERRSRRIARAIVGRRPLRTTTELAEAVASAVGRAGNRGRRRLHPATHVFRALRLAVNRELERLSAFLESARGMVRTGARMVVISFHSLEDRIVKRFLQERSRRPREEGDAEPVWRVLTRKVVRPGSLELSENPRARSARLRAAESI